MTVSPKVYAMAALIGLVLAIAGVWGGSAGQAQARSQDQAQLHKEVFYVVCYDVGKAALDRAPGVEKVTSGWKDGREINTVWYDPTVTNLLELENRLKSAGTYDGTAEQPGSP